MPDLPESLRLALATRLTGLPTEPLRLAVDRLIESYRSGSVPGAPILRSETDVAAYAAYRMPATYAAVRAAFAALPPDFAPASCLDVGGGTGAAVWAALDAFPGIGDVTVVDQVRSALDFGASLALGSPVPALRRATWEVQELPGELPTADLVSVSYLLGELSSAAQAAVIEAAAAAAGTLVVIEPGTPAGYARILDARTRLIALGWRVVAPCPHQATCPIPAGRDWCHFGTRVNRSALHRRLKDGDLSYEDEKFSYVAAVRDPAPAAIAEVPNPSAGRVLRRPAQRKGLVQLRLCTPMGTLADRNVSKRQGADYRLARDTAWGDLYGD